MDLLWKSDLENGCFRNPVLYADYSDPDVILVGDTYYMTASSFNYIPGLPILTSKDLVNWTLKNYAIKKALPGSIYNSPAHAKGIWAPSIRFHNGIFYIFVGMPDEGIYMLKTTEPLGDWSDPLLILPGKGYIDPCPFWEDDGTAYIVHGYAKSRIGFKSILGIVQMTSDGKRCIGDDSFLYDGTVKNPTIEGPKVYKKNNYYYIFAPAGGVRNGWQTVLRSKQLFGPYEEKIVMHQGSSEINGPHQGALVSTVSGEDWFLHFQDAGVYGRITHLQPVHWQSDWPIIGKDVDGSRCGEPQYEYRKPNCNSIDVEPCYLEASDFFESSILGLQWQWMANVNNSFYSLLARPHCLRLYCLNTADSSTPVLWNCANILTQKIICPSFTADFSIEVFGLQENERAGILMIGDEYSSLAFQRDSCGLSLIYLESFTESSKKYEKVLFSTLVDKADISFSYSAILRIRFDKHMVCHMEYSFDAENFIAVPFTTVPKDHTWVGAKIGMYSIALDKSPHIGYTDFTRVEVKATNE